MKIINTIIVQFSFDQLYKSKYYGIIIVFFNLSSLFLCTLCVEGVQIFMWCYLKNCFNFFLFNLMNNSVDELIAMRCIVWIVLCCSDEWVCCAIACCKLTSNVVNQLSSVWMHFLNEAQYRCAYNNKCLRCIEMRLVTSTWNSSSNYM